MNRPALAMPTLPTDDALERVCLALERDDAPADLASLAAIAGLSPTHLQRVFRRRYGVSPAEYARARRFGHLREALRSGSAVTDAVYDAVGRDTFDQSLKCLAYFGSLVNYGQASGPVEPVPPATLGIRSNSLSRPVVFHYVRDRNSLDAMAAEVFAAFAAGVLRAETALQVPLADAAKAHAALEDRTTVGATVLLP